MIPFVSVIYVKSVHQTRFGCLGEKFRFNRFGKILWINLRWYASLFRWRIECSCSSRFIYLWTGVLLNEIPLRFLFFAAPPSSYGAPCPPGNHDKVLESVDNNKFFKRDNPFFISEVVVISIWMNAQLFKKPPQSELLPMLIKKTIFH